MNGDRIAARQRTIPNEGAIAEALESLSRTYRDYKARSAVYYIYNTKSFSLGGTLAKMILPCYLLSQFQEFTYVH